MGLFAGDAKLCLLEFLKSLMIAYTPSTSTLNQDRRLRTGVLLHRIEIFRGQAGRTTQFSGEDLDLYVKRFYDKALDCSHPVNEDVLVNVSLHEMVGECQVFLENRSFPSFLKLMKASRRTNESMKNTPKPSPTSCPNRITRKFPRPSNSKKSSYRQDYRWKKNAYPIFAILSLWYQKSHSSVRIMGQRLICFSVILFSISIISFVHTPWGL